MTVLKVLKSAVLGSNMLMSGCTVAVVYNGVTVLFRYIPSMCFVCSVVQKNNKPHNPTYRY